MAHGQKLSEECEGTGPGKICWPDFMPQASFYCPILHPVTQAVLKDPEARRGKQNPNLRRFVVTRSDLEAFTHQRRESSIRFRQRPQRESSRAEYVQERGNSDGRRGDRVAGVGNCTGNRWCVRCRDDCWVRFGRAGGGCCWRNGGIGKLVVRVLRPGGHPELPGRISFGFCYLISNDAVVHLRGESSTTECGRTIRQASTRRKK
jgi:hypothetical protein